MDTRRQGLQTIAGLFVLGNVFAASGVLADDGFVFAGLSLNTTVEDARKRYPHSLVSGHHVYVAEIDSHDDVRAVDIPADGPNRRLRVYLERRTTRGARYPRCDAVLEILRKQFGAPSRVQEFDEERARDRRLTWWRGNEAMSLLCFRIGQEPFFASDLTIAFREHD